METGHDLIFRWVPRMVIFSLYLEKKIPFHTVYLHGLVNDAQGKKMSKSKGNVISPVEIIEKYGTDALRMALVVGNSPGTDTSLVENKVRGYKNFANKIWNISRFVLSNIENINFSEKTELTEKDGELLKELADLTIDITADLENYRFHLASEKIYHYIWHRFADEIIEDSKKIFSQDSTESTKLEEEKLAENSRRQTLLKILRQITIVLHPFMPFVTEEIWPHLPKQKVSDMLMIEKWPV